MAYPVGKLTTKQAFFVKEYLIDFNATRAAVAAGYSPKHAHKMAYQLLQNPLIQEAIRAAIDERSKRTEITADMVLKELAKIGFSDIRKAVQVVKKTLVNEDGEQYATTYVEMIPSDEWDDGIASVVAGVSQSAGMFGNNIKIKLHPKIDALDKLAKHLGMYDKKEPGESEQESSVEAYRQVLTSTAEEVWSDEDNEGDRAV